MDNISGALSEDDVSKINRIVETLNQSTFDYLQIEIGEFKLTIAKGRLPTAEGPVAAAETGSPAPAPAAPRPGPPPPAAATSRDPAKDDGTIAITAPLVGRFYSQPEPGAAPFVAVGSDVADDTTVGLIEVMKTFNAVRAGVSGSIAEICVQDTTLVDYGQVLFRVRPKV